jgi:hypothetical protein
MCIRDSFNARLGNACSADPLGVSEMVDIDIRPKGAAGEPLAFRRDIGGGRAEKAGHGHAFPWAVREKVRGEDQAIRMGLGPAFSLNRPSAPRAIC